MIPLRAQTRAEHLLLSSASRRRFLSYVGGTIGLSLGRPTSGVELRFDEVKQFGLNLVILRNDPLNAETTTSVFDRYLTPNEYFFVRSHLPTPNENDGGLLSIEGEVSKPIKWTLSELQQREQVTITAVLQCSGNGRSFYEPKVDGVSWTRGAVGNAEWTGVRLKDLLEEAGIGSKTQHVQFRGGDKVSSNGDAPFLRSLPIDRALDPNTLVAFKMNGDPLPLEHGGPMRLVVPGWFGNHWMKWLQSIKLSKEESPGPYQRSSYRFPAHPTLPGTFPDPGLMTPITRMPVKSLIARPAMGQHLKQGLVEILGVAWSGMGTVDQVEVATSADGPYKPATVFGPDRPFGWRLWRYQWNATSAGKFQLRSRATDSAGYTQPDSVPWNPKGYVWNAVDRINVQVG